jgi:hypothetical protein
MQTRGFIITCYHIGVHSIKSDLGNGDVNRKEGVERQNEKKHLEGSAGLITRRGMRMRSS